MSNLPASVLQKIVSLIAAELSVQPRQVAAAVNLLDEGATVPFIARYRKERTGELDEVQIRTEHNAQLVATITHGSAVSLGLKAGSSVIAMVKAPSVMVVTNCEGVRFSAFDYINAEAFDRHPSDFDERHRIVASGIVGLLVDMLILKPADYSCPVDSRRPA